MTILVLLYVESTNGYHNLCRLLSRHAERTATDEATKVLSPPSNAFHSAVKEFHGLTEGLIAVSDERRVRLAEMFRGRFYRIVSAREMLTDFPSGSVPRDSLLDA